MGITPFQWKCPYCDHDATISDDDYHLDQTDLTISNADGERRVYTEFIVCPNPECKRLTLAIRMCRLRRSSGTWFKGDLVKEWRLVPPSKAVVFPEYVPKPIRDDYTEACLIADLSPKASATLSRRCLQGIVRHFWKVKAGRLVDEIDQVKEKTDSLTWEAIGAVRKVGNIGAHMEKDIDLIIEVEPGEAELLIELIETLVRDWYVARRERDERLEKIKAMAEEKDSLRRREGTEEHGPQQ